MRTKQRKTNIMKKSLDLKTLIQATGTKVNLIDLLETIKIAGYIIDYQTDFMGFGYINIFYDLAIEVRVLNALKQVDFDESLQK